MDGHVPVVREVVVADVEPGVVGVHPQADRLVVVDVVPRHRRTQVVPELAPAGAAAGAGAVGVVVLRVVVGDLVVGDGEVGDRDRVRARIGLEPVLAVLGQTVVVEHPVGIDDHARPVGVVLDGRVLDRPAAGQVPVDHPLLLRSREVLDGQVLDGDVGARAGDGVVVLVLAVEDRPGPSDEDVVVRQRRSGRTRPSPACGCPRRTSRSCSPGGCRRTVTRCPLLGH